MPLQFIVVPATVPCRANCARWCHCLAAFLASDFSPQVVHGLRVITNRQGKPRLYLCTSIYFRCTTTSCWKSCQMQHSACSNPKVILPDAKSAFPCIRTGASGELVIWEHAWCELNDKRVALNHSCSQTKPTRAGTLYALHSPH